MAKRNGELARIYRKMPCLVCGYLPSELDHIKTIGSGGPDEPRNAWPLCRRHHIEKHNLGLVEFVNKYQLQHELEVRGFHFDEFMNRYWLKIEGQGWESFDAENKENKNGD